MRYQYRGSWEAREPRAFFEKAYRRRSLAAWDARWQQLTVQARYSFLHVVKLPEKDPTGYGSTPSAPRDNFPPHVLDELAAAGFVRIEPARSAATSDRVLAGDGTNDFAWRGRILRRMHLLDADRASEFSKYVEEVFSSVDLLAAVVRVLRTAGFEGYFRLDELLRRYVATHRWPDWVAHALDLRLAIPILKVVKESGGAMPLLELCGRIEGRKPDEVRAVVDQLIAHLVLVEDLQPETWEILVGFLPAVREQMARASQPRERPPLVICEGPKELAPHGSVLVNDLRAILLEIANAPPRIRADRGLYQRESERFLPVLDPLPAWLVEALQWSTEGRLNQAVEWADTLQLVKEVAEGRITRLQLSSSGQHWLSSGLQEQYAAFIDILTRAPSQDESYPTRETLYDPGGGAGASRRLVSDDSRFFGEHVVVQKLDKQGMAERVWGSVVPAEELSLRSHMDRALAVLKPGVFYRLDSVASHLVFKEHNPVNAGRPPDRVLVRWANERVPAFEEEREAAGRSLIETFVRRRLIPLGCVRAGMDQEGKICIARELSCELYFGHKIDPAGLAAPPDHPGRVVVQPDFSVIVIGLNPATIAELTLFCERTTKGGSQGATVLKITRESVVKAVRLGLKPAEIMARLTRHASNELPANVLREVKEWSSWVRHVTLSTMTVIRCDERDTADRIMDVLRRQAERISDTMIAIDHVKLTANERDKLLGQGIIIQTDSDDRKQQEDEAISDLDLLSRQLRGLRDRRSGF